MEGSHQKVPLRGMRLAACCFPAVAFFVAFYCLGGDLGRYYDDYVFAGRDPRGDCVDWAGNPWQHAPFFWRPLLFPFLYYLLAACWKSMWVMHTLNVLAHAAVTISLYALLRSFTHTRQAAVAATLVFAFFPLQFDIVFWSTAITCSIPAALTLVMLNLFVRYAKGTTNRHLLWLIVLAFIIPCWYEQPITLVPALPLLYMAFRPDSVPMGRAMGRCLRAVVPMGLMLCVYLALMMATVPAGRRGGATSFVHASELASRIRFVAGSVVHLATIELVEYGRGGIETAWEELSTARGIMLVCLVLTTAGLWMAWFVHDAPPEQPRHSGRQRLWCVLFGLSWFLLAWLPFVPIKDQWVTPRCWQVPLLGLSIALAAGIDAILARPWARDRCLLSRGVVAACVIAIVWPSVLALCGWQVLYRTRFRANEQQLAELKQRIPSPPPMAVFVPLNDAFLAGKSHSLLFNVGLIGWTGSFSTVHGALRNAYARTDLHSTHKDFWNPLPLTELSEKSFGYAVPMPGYVNQSEGSTVPWDMAIPFFIDPAGHIVIADLIEIRKGGATTIIKPRLAATATPGLTAKFVIER